MQSSNFVLQMGALTPINNILEVVTAHQELLIDTPSQAAISLQVFKPSQPWWQYYLSQYLQSKSDQYCTVTAHMDYTKSYLSLFFRFPPFSLKIEQMHLAANHTSIAADQARVKWQVSLVQAIFAWLDHFNSVLYCVSPWLNSRYLNVW